MKPINILLTTLCICASFYTNANAQSNDLKPLNSDAIICESKPALQEFMKYVASGDKNSIREMDTCFTAKPGVKYRILESSIGGMVKIKVYMGNNNEGAVAWTMKPFLAIITLLTTLLTSPAHALQKVCFSPSTCCEDNIVELIQNSQNSIEIAIYAFTNQKIYEALKEGRAMVKVRSFLL